MRSESEIFEELAAVCSSSGYIHVIAYFSWRDNIVDYDKELNGDDYAKLYSSNRLIRTEISTLIGLMACVPIEYDLPSPDEFQELINKTEALLAELHDVLKAPFYARFQEHEVSSKDVASSAPMLSAEMFREAIFYAAESAYPSQYGDLSAVKYARDTEWLRANKRFTSDEARSVLAAILAYLTNKFEATLKALHQKPLSELTVLDGFIFTINEIAEIGNIPKEIVEAVVDAFSYQDDGNPTFKSLGDFNATNAYPILKGVGDDRILLQYVSLAEALYETPYFWFLDDASYKSTASINRGAFTEDFTAKRLETVFGKNRVFINVDIWETPSQKTKIGEIDVLALIGNIAIVVQAKSKKLTILARKGNDLQLQIDFKAAVQDACDQAVLCSKCLINGSYYLTDSSGTEVKFSSKLTKIHPLCVVSDHYPALAYQAQQFLSFNATKGIVHPLVCDVFFIDVVTEFLTTPLRLLSYLELRSIIGNRMILSHEIVALGYHLRNNLWLGENNLLVLDDSLVVDVDIAMAVRREGLDGKGVPQGVLTALQGTPIGKILKDIEAAPEPENIAVGLEILKLSSEGLNDLNEFIEYIKTMAKQRHQSRNASLMLDEGNVGITIHCNFDPDFIARPNLDRHIKQRKYAMQASKWFGVSLNPENGALRFCLVDNNKWQRNFLMDAKVSNLKAMKPTGSLRRALSDRELGRSVGRNDPCPCGSGLKYKKCHLG